MKIIAVEEHWNSAGIRDALDRLPDGARDESVAFNTMGDNQARLEDIGQGRVEAMDVAGIDVLILSVVTPGAQALPAREAVALARDANDEATSAVRVHPDRFRAFATLPTSDPQAAAVELERCATQLGHVGAMVHGRAGTRPPDDPAYDDLFATVGQIHPPPAEPVPERPSDQQERRQGQGVAGHHPLHGPSRRGARSRWRARRCRPPWCPVQRSPSRAW